MTSGETENQFQKVHRLAREERLRRHEIGCGVCRTNPDLCIIRAQITGLSRQQWLDKQKRAD
jgi:hypothetical protein